MEIVTSNQIKDHNSSSGVIFMDEKYHKSMTLVKMRNQTRNQGFYNFLCYTRAAVKSDLRFRLENG